MYQFQSPARSGIRWGIFGGLRSPSIHLGGSQPTRSTILCQRATDNTKSHPDPGIEVSRSQSPSKQPLEFCRLLFHHDTYYAYMSFLRAYPTYIDILRKCEHKRLKRSAEVYMDYTGDSLSGKPHPLQFYVLVLDFLGGHPFNL